MSTQLFAPHSVDTSDTNSIDPRSWRALMSRGSSTSRKIVMSDSIGRSTKQVKLLKNLVFLSMQQKFTHMRFPCLPCGGGLGWGVVEANARGRETDASRAQSKCSKGRLVSTQACRRRSKTEWLG